MCQIQLLPLCNWSRDNHLPGSWNELPVILSYWSKLKQIASVASEGSYGTASDVNTSSFVLVIANTWTSLSSFSLESLWHKTFFFLFSIPLPVLPSPLPASPSPPSVSGTQSMTGSRAWLSVYTGTWGRSRTTSAQRTRSSEAISTIFKVFSKVSRTPESWF